MYIFAHRNKPSKCEETVNQSDCRNLMKYMYVNFKVNLKSGIIDQVL